MNRPIFLTRTQRAAPILRRALAGAVVVGLFVGLGLAIGWWVAR